MILRNPYHHRPLPRTGFTLLEILVVVAIILALAGLGGYYVIGQYNESKVSSAKIQAKTISSAVDTYFIDHGVYPPSLEVLLQKDEQGKGPYLKSRDALLDPWDRPYQYDVNGTRNHQAGAVVPIPDVFTVTPDGRQVGNWAEPKR